MHARTAHGLVAVHQLFALAEGIQEYRHRPQVERIGTQPHQVVQDAGDLIEHGADVLRTLRRFDPHQRFDRTHVGVLVAHHRDVVESIHVADRLVERLGFSQFFRATVQQADVRVGAHDGFAIHFQDQTQHAMRGRMLRAEVHGVVADFLAAFGRIAGKRNAGRLHGHGLASPRAAASPAAVW